MPIFPWWSPWASVSGSRISSFYKVSSHSGLGAQEDLLGFPGGSDGKESACNAEDPRSIPGSGRPPGEGHGYPLQYSCLENHGQRSLAGYNPCGCKESNTAEWLTHTHTNDFILVWSSSITLFSNKSTFTGSGCTWIWSKCYSTQLSIGLAKKVPLGFSHEML